MQTRVLCLDPLVYGPKDMANQKVDHSDITTGGNGPFPQKRTPFFPRPSYRQTIANSLAIAKLSPGSILNVNFCFWNAVATLRLILDVGVCVGGWGGWVQDQRWLGYVPYILYLIYFFGCYILSLYCRWNQDFMHWLCVVYLTFSRLALGTSTSLEVACLLTTSLGWLTAYLTYLPTYLPIYLLYPPTLPTPTCLVDVFKILVPAVAVGAVIFKNSSKQRSQTATSQTLFSRSVKGNNTFPSTM